MIKILAKKWLEFEREVYLRKHISEKKRVNIPINKARRFLCIQMNAIGDVIMTQPAWSSLKSCISDASVDLICRPHIAPLFVKDPAINAIFPAENRRYRSWLFVNEHQIKKLLTTNKYDVLIDFTALPLTASICAQRGATPSIGFQRILGGKTGGIDLGLCYDKAFPYSEEAPLRELMLQLVSPWAEANCGRWVPVLHLSKAVMKKTNNLLRQKGLLPGRFVVMHPGGKWPPKRWPPEHWKKLIDSLVRELSFDVLILGSKEDGSLINNIFEGSLHNTNTKCQLILSDELDISSAIIEAAALCISNDSAAMHIAAALKTKSIALFGPVAPIRSAPTREEGCTVLYENMFCSPCTLYYSRTRCRRGINFCMYAISPEKVLEKARAILSDTST